ncbi:oxepin-CoA hydrolase, alternative type [Sagittula stellata]|uniref:Enoyl-CoA hydratase n=1 Tax=Sagittula stellata (strain ATCC 700073 / DSM 11524 / E-37) TaxID=388399 RepID=A3K5D6_SAGS3|nr:enoyl-CoA hydratase family protein [Sagittula stellata]EBA07737.1 enoyl-CoA hydratase [Sagittula stellata E-37]
MTDTVLKTERKGAVLVLTLDGAKSRNSIGPELYTALREAVIDASDDPQVRAVVLTGANGYFCSGGNVAMLKASASRPRGQVSSNTDLLNALIRAVYDAPVPVVCALEGGAAGAGASLALACDMLVAAEGASLVIAYVKVGLTPDGGATHFLRGALPRQLVMEMCMTGRPMPVERLADFGLVNELAVPGNALTRAIDIAERLADGPAAALASIKHTVNMAEVNGLTAQMALEADGINRARYTEEAAEGLAAFLEKRRPVYR